MSINAVTHDSCQMFSLIIPVYKNEANITELLEALKRLHCDGLTCPLEVIFVVDGSPDNSLELLSAGLKEAPFRSKLISLTRNFGSFSAIRAGLKAGTGTRFGVMAADLQEPPELIREFDEVLATNMFDVCLGVRVSRQDPLLTKLSARVFWGLYRRFVVSEVPPGGVDVFSCTRAVRDELVRLSERNSSLVGLLLWVGFRRASVPYTRRRRTEGRSAWTVKKKVVYFMDSIFSFSDLPIRLLSVIGLLGMAFSGGLATQVAVAKFANQIPVAGFTTTIVVVAFFGGLNCLGLGIIGGYVWRTFENTKERPNFIIASESSFGEASGG